MEEKESGKQVSIITLGNRGNVQPYIAIALALQSKKYTVRILSSEEHSDFVKSFSIHFTSIWKRALCNQLQTGRDYLNHLKSSMTYNANKFVNSVLNDLQTHPPNIIIAGPFSEYFEYYARYFLRIPTLPIHLSVFYWGIDHRYYYDVRNFIYDCFEIYDSKINMIGHPRLCKKLSRDDFIYKFEQGRHKVVSVCQPASYYNLNNFVRNFERVNLIGPCVINAQQEQCYDKYFGGPETRAKIDSFLAKEKDPEKKPVFCGWGSANSLTPEVLYNVIEALTMCQQRAILLIPNLTIELIQKIEDCEGYLKDHYWKENMLLLSQVPCEYLFPKVKFVLHHGGKGTSMAALRAGVPSFILATAKFQDGQCFEQYQQSNLILSFGLGISCRDETLESFDPEELASNILHVIRDTGMFQRCKEMGENLKRIDGCYYLTNTIDSMATKSPLPLRTSPRHIWKLKHNRSTPEHEVKENDEITVSKSLPDNIHENTGNAQIHISVCILILKRLMIFMALIVLEAELNNCSTDQIWLIR